MLAKDALNQSEHRLIMADMFEGLVIIQQLPAEETSSAERFLVQFVSHDADGWHDGSGILTAGRHYNLDDAITAASGKFGISDEAWIPVNRYATAILGPMLAQDRPVDISRLLKSNSLAED